MVLFRRFLIFILWFSCVFDPVGTVYGIKYFSLCVMLIYLMLMLAMKRICMSSIGFGGVSLIFMVCILMPVYGLFIFAYRGGGGPFIDTSYIYSSLFMLFFFLNIERSDFDFSVGVFIFFLKLLSILIIIVFLSTLFLPQSFLVDFVLSKNLVFISSREYAGVITPYIYFIVSPTLVFLVCQSTSDMYKKISAYNIFIVMLSIFAMFLTGTRMNMLFSLFGFFMTIFWLRFGRGAYVFLFVIFTVLFLFFYDSPFIAAAMSTSDVSNSTKIGYLTYYAKQFDFFDILIFGEGYNAHSWSSELNELLVPGASKLELTYLELIRVYGLLISSVFFLLVMWNTAFIKYFKFCNNNWIQPAIVSYLLMSFSNPYLFSMNGIMVLSICVAYKYQKN